MGGEGGERRGGRGGSGEEGREGKGGEGGAVTTPVTCGSIVMEFRIRSYLLQVHHLANTH